MNPPSGASGSPLDSQGPALVATNGAPEPRALRPRHAVEAFIVGLVLMFLCGVLAVPLADVLGGAAAIVATQLGILGAVAFVLLRLRLPLTAAVSLRAPGGRAVLGSALLAIGALLFSGTTAARLYDFGEGSYARELMVYFDQLITQLGVPVVMALLGLLVPFCEELLFRGVVLRGLLGRWPPAVAIAGSALLFAIYHLHPVHALVALVLGLAAGWAVVASGSFWAGFLVHAVNNLIVTAGGVSGAESTGEVLPLGWGVAGAMILGLGAVVVGRGSASPRAKSPEVGTPRDPRPSLPEEILDASENLPAERDDSGAPPRSAP